MLGVDLSVTWKKEDAVRRRNLMNIHKEYQDENQKRPFRGQHGKGEAWQKEKKRYQRIHTRVAIWILCTCKCGSGWQLVEKGHCQRIAWTIEAELWAHFILWLYCSMAQELRKLSTHSPLPLLCWMPHYLLPLITCKIKALSYFNVSFLH